MAITRARKAINQDGSYEGCRSKMAVMFVVNTLPQTNTIAEDREEVLKV